MNRIIETLQGRDLCHEGTLTRGNHGIVPYIQYDGVGNFSHTKPYEYLGLTGFTTGLWVYPTAANGFLEDVWAIGGFQVWRLYLNTLTPTFDISSDGNNSKTVTSTIALALNTWHFVACRYTPSIEIAIWVNGTKTITTAAIYANLFNTTTPNFVIGSDHSNSIPFTGRLAMAFFSNAVLADAFLLAIYSMGKPMFNL